MVQKRELSENVERLFSEEVKRLMTKAIHLPESSRRQMIDLLTKTLPTLPLVAGLDDACVKFWQFLAQWAYDLRGIRLPSIEAVARDKEDRGMLGLLVEDLLLSASKLQETKRHTMHKDKFLSFLARTIVQGASCEEGNRRWYVDQLLRTGASVIDAQYPGYRASKLLYKLIEEKGGG